MKPIILFDINETVLSLSTIRPLFAEVFGDAGLCDTWFASLLHSSTVAVITGVTTSFAELAAIKLQEVAARQQQMISDATCQAMLAQFSKLKAHTDVPAALASLKGAGFTTVAFSNSSQALLAEQLCNAGLDDAFDQSISLQLAQTFKPDPRAYQFGAEYLGVAPSELLLLACHDWDTHGALVAGLHAAYLDRTGVRYNPLYRKPTLYSASMIELSEAIIATYG